MEAYSFHTTITPCYAWHCLSLIWLVSCLVSSLPSKGSQANIHQGFVTRCYGGVKDATLTLQSIHSLIRSQTDVMDDVSAWVPMQWLASSASLDNSIYTTHCAWSHRINIWACLPFSRGAFGAFSEFITPRGRCLCSSLFSVSKITFRPSCRRVAYSARLKSKDLHLGDNRCLICAVMWDEVKADRETVMNLYKNVLSSTTTEPGGMHTMNYFHPFYFFTIIIPIHVCQLQ